MTADRSVAQKLAASDADGALRLAVPALEGDGGLDAFYAVLEALVRAGKKSGVADAAATLARAFGASGRWPMALATAAVARDAGGDRLQILRALARVYGAEAPRLSDGLAVAPATEAPAPALAKGVKGGELYGRALQAATLAAATLESAPEPDVVPRAPLLSRLSGEAFVTLASAFEPKWIPDGEALIRQGEEGDAVYVLADGMLRVRRAKDGEADTVELARLGPGALVGEMAIVSRAPRSASVVASGPALVLAADRAALDAAAEDTTVATELVAHCRRRMAETLLAASPMLSSVPSNERPLVLAALTPRPVSAGDVLVTEGADADGLTLVVQGEVEVSRSDGGEKTVIARLGPGDVVGEISVVMRRPATASVVATTDCLTLHLHRDAFLPLAKAHPTLLARLYELAVERETETLNIVAAEAVDAEELLI